MRRAPLLVVVLLGCSRKDQDAPAPPPPAALVAPAPTPREPPSAPPLEVPPPPLTGKTVLHVGDSMVGDHWGLTRALAAKIEREGGKVVRSTKVSETIASFDRDPGLRDLLRKHQPDVVVITLGTNDTTVPHPDVNAKHVASIAKRIAPRECWWIGPPMNGSKDNGIAEVIAKNSAPCKFFDSRPVKLERGRDGIHPTDKGGAVWADEFWSAFRAPVKGSAVSDRRP